MFDPCNPCVCPGAPCEQCTYGYRSAESNHKAMKELLLEYKAGKRPYGWHAAETYMTFHRDWEQELAKELEEEKMSACKETLCTNCIHCPVCANKNTIMDIQKQIDNLFVGETAVCDITWLKLSLTCEHFRQNSGTVKGV